MTSYRGIIAVICGGILGVCVTSFAFGADGHGGLALVGSLLGAIAGIYFVRRLESRAK